MNQPAKRFLIIALVLAVWLAARLVGWVGYAGADDQFYARYAWLLHRLPMNHMESRLPAVLAMAASFRLLGPTELAAALPSLLASLATLASVAWVVGWPRRLDWTATGSVLVACLLPIDVGYASYPAASSVSAGFLALGTACLVKGNRWVAIIGGGALLGLGFMTHVMTFYYVALLCLAAFFSDWRKYWPPVLACVLFSGGFLLVECAAYWAIAGDPLLRWHALGGGGYTLAEVLADQHKTRLQYFLEPLRMLLYEKAFGFCLLVAVAGGAFTWRRLDATLRILLIATFSYWFWLGYGTTVPWTYRPATHGQHYSLPLVLGVCVLTPTVLKLALAPREKLAQAALAALLLINVLWLGVGGNWGQRVDVSRDLLRYAQAHPRQKFLADIYTMNEMYLVNGFELPANVICLNSPLLVGDLLANKEPEGQRNVRFEEPTGLAGIIVNYERIDNPPEPEFTDFLKAHQGKRLHAVPKRYRLLFAPLVPMLGERGFMIRSQGGAVFAYD